MKRISILVPVYNEEGNLLDTCNTLKQLMEGLKDRYDYEIIFTDNHSNDKTFEILENIAKKDLRIKVARFSKNFGYERSIYTGYILSSGDAVVQIDCDLQDPPEKIPEFIKKWEEGFAVVYGVRKKRQETWVLNLTRKIFYRLLNFLSEDNLPKDAGEFRLVDKKIVDEMRKLYDYYPYVRGLIASFGFEQVGIPYDRGERKKGVSKFRFYNLVDLAIDGIVNHSIAPLRLTSYVSFIVFIGAFCFLLVYAIGRGFFHQDWPRGFATIVTLILFFLGLNMLFLGIIGEYLGRIYQQVKRYPISIIEKSLNFTEK